MKTILLLAGRSKRFWPLEDKMFLPICGRTLLEIQVDHLQKGGCTDIVLVGGAHNLKKAKEFFPTFEAIEQENLELGMRGALLSTLPHYGSEPVCVVSGNDVIEPEGYASLLAKAKELGVDGVLLAQRVDHYFPGGYLTLEGKRIAGILEKPGAGHEPSTLVNIVAHYHRDPSALLQALQRVSDEGDDGYEQALSELFKEKIYHAAPYDGAWSPVKYPWHMLRLLPIFLESSLPFIHRKAIVHPSATVEGNVTLDEGARVLPHATIIGPTHVGKFSVIGTGTLVRGSSIGEWCVIGFGTEVKSSVIAHHVWTHMAYVGDSVIGNNVAFGSGSITGNLRLDEGEIQSTVDGKRVATGLRKFGTVIGDNCRIGINVSLNPGVKIGKGVFIGGGAVISEDIGDYLYVKAESSRNLSTRENTATAPSPVSREEFRKAAKL